MFSPRYSIGSLVAVTTIAAIAVAYAKVGLGLAAHGLTWATFWTVVLWLIVYANPETRGRIRFIWLLLVVVTAVTLSGLLAINSDTETYQAFVFAGTVGGLLFGTLAGLCAIRPIGVPSNNSECTRVFLPISRFIERLTFARSCALVASMTFVGIAVGAAITLLFWVINDVHPADRWVLLEVYGKIGAMIGFAGGWAWCGTLAARQFWHSTHLPSEGSPLRFGVWFVSLLVSIVGIVFWFSIPAAHINAGTCAHIRPSMAQEEVDEIVGAPPGWYDGVGGINSGAPAYKGDDAAIWVGLGGELVVELDTTGQVAQATFYSGKVSNWSPGEFLWERCTKVKYMGLSIFGRTILHLSCSALAVFVLGIAIIRPDSKNRIALHGFIGLIVGTVLSFAVFPDGLVADLLSAAIALSGPLLGAIAGMAVGFAFEIVERRSVTELSGVARGT